MERPAYLRADLYKLIVESAEELRTRGFYEKLLSYGYTFESKGDTVGHESLLEAVLNNPSPYLYHQLHILTNPDLLTNLFIEFEDGELDSGHTYLIDREAAEEIAVNDPTIMLRDGSEGRLVPRIRIEQAFKNGCMIDYHTPHNKIDA